MPAHTPRTANGTSTPAQHQRIYILGAEQGYSREALKDMVGVDSMKELSAKDASELIVKLGGDPLPSRSDPPRFEPRKAAPPDGVTRMITPDQVEQIERLLVHHFGRSYHGNAWIQRTFKVREPRELKTAEQAGKCIAVLKQIINRRQEDRNRYAR